MREAEKPIASVLQAASSVLGRPPAVQDVLKDVVWFVPDEEGKKKPTKKNPERPKRVSHISLLPKMHKAKVSCRALAANPHKAEVPTARRVNSALTFIWADHCDRYWYDLCLSTYRRSPRTGGPAFSWTSR